MGRVALHLVRDDARATDPAVGRVVGASAQRLRIVDGALTCVARQGVAKTTLLDLYLALQRRQFGKIAE